MAMQRLVAAGLAVLIGSAAPAAGQDPALPGAVTAPPAWLAGARPPFDVAAYFAAPPPGQNAAPLYLDALFEFGPEMAACFPRGDGVNDRTQAAQARLDRLNELERATSQQPMKTAEPAAIDAVLRLYDAGFRKLAEAQKRPACRFQPGLGFTALMPHAQASRQVTRVAALRVRRALDRGDVGAALDDVAIVLRLSRDLRPGGVAVTQLVANALVATAAKELIEPILASPALKPTDGQRLVRLLSAHDAEKSAPVTDALEAHYLLALAMLRDASGRAEAGPKEASLPRRELVAAVLEVAPQSPEAGAALEAFDGLDEAGYRGLVGRVDGLYGALLGLPPGPPTRRIAAARTIVSALPKGDAPSRFAVKVAPPFELVTASSARVRAIQRASLALTALRLSQLTRGGTAADLATACRAAGLPGVPVDPFSGQPLKPLTDGQPGVYSIGLDGKDDGGRVDSNQDRKPGDLIYRLPPAGPAGPRGR